MAEYIIDKIEYGGNVYKLQDSVSDFLTGAVTALSTTEGQHSTITNQNGAVSIAIPTKTSHLTNDSGFLTSHQDISGKADKSSTVSNITYNSTSRTLKKTINGTTSDVVDFGTAAFKLFTDSISNTSTNLPTSAAVASFVEGKGYLTSYTETDPVFSASAAAGITSTDISNWNAKVSDDKTWNGVTLTTTQTNVDSLYYIPAKDSTTLSGQAKWFKATSTPTDRAVAKYDSSAYLKSTTPSANDNSTKVATTAYVDAAIPTVPTNVSAFTNDSNYITVSDITVSSSGSGNVVTGISKTNGVITYTLGTVTTVAAQIVRW